MPSHASLAKRPRLSYTPSPLSIAAQSFAAEEELARQRFLSQSKLKSSWEGIFAKYSQSFEGIADEIDQVTGEIVVDNGHVKGLPVNFRGMKNEAEWERDEIMGGAGGMGGKGATKKVRLWDGMRLARKRDIGEDDTAPIAVGCEACRFQDELDDSVCLSCFPQRSTPPTVAKTTTTTTILTHLAHGSVSAPASPATSVSKSPLRKSPRTSPASGKGVLVAGAPSSQSKDLPSDDFILEKLGSHGAAVVGFLAKARAQSVMSSPIPIFTRGDDTPSKSRTSYIRERIEVEISPRRAKSPSYTTAPPPAMKTLSPQPGPLQNLESCTGQVDIRTWTPTKVTAWMLTNGILHDVDDTDLARVIEKHQVSGAVIAGSAPGRSLTLNDLKDKLEIPSFSKRMQLWSGILKLKALAPTPLRRSQRQATSPLFNSVSAASTDLPATPAEAVDLWAPPPIQEDPFYSHIWRDEHPDGTPTKFPPRLEGPMFFKMETHGCSVTASAAKKGVKRKRGPSAESITPELVKVEDVEGGLSVEKLGGVKTPKVGTPVAKTSAGRPLEQGVLKLGGARTPAAKSPRTKTPAAKAPRERTPTKTPTTKSLTTETPTGTATTKTATTKILITKTPTPKTPITKTPAVKASITKTPVTVTPATKTPTAKAPISKTPAAKTPTTVMPATKTPTAKAPIAKIPAAKTLTTVTPATKTPTAKAPITATPVKKTPITKTPAKMIPMKTPAKTPVPKTPATAQHPQAGVTPGWTTNSSIQTERRSLRSILLLGDDPESDSDDELSLPANNNPRFTRKATALGAMVKDEGDDDDDDDDDADITAKEEGDGSEDIEEERGEKKTQGHNCTGGFCFVCLSLDGSEDDLI